MLKITKGTLNLLDKLDDMYEQCKTDLLQK